MSEYKSSALEDVIATLEGAGNPVMTVRIENDANGTKRVDVVTKEGMAAAGKLGGDDGVHLSLETTEKAKVGLDVSPQALQKLEEALNNTPVGATQQAVDLEKLFHSQSAPESNVPTTPVTPAPQAAAETAPALKITATDPEQAIYSVEMNPAALSEQVLYQLEKFRIAQAFGAQSDELVAQMDAGIIKERPDLQPAMDKIIQERGQGHTLGNNAAHRDEQGEGKFPAANQSGNQMAVAQESFETTVSLPRPGTSSGSLTEVSSHVKDANHQGRVVAEKQAAMAHG
jgi:hypothetical protein